ncbi:MAG: ACP S-malonyltransferase [Gemmatimonadota bacterium]
MRGATAVLFPGQGSQFLGMGQDLAERFEEVRELYEQADEILSFQLSQVSWKGPEERLVSTENAQPSILLHSYAIWSLLEKRLSGSVCVGAGHSLGEISAHLAAGTFSFPDALRLVRRRGELMARSGRERPGAMTAILGLALDVVEAICAEESEGTVVPANLNAPGQIVISGDAAAVERAGERARAAGARRVVPLPVSGAFHSPLMGEARRGLEEILQDTPMRDPRFPVASNATARLVRTAAEARRTLVLQLTSPVRWVEDVGVMKGEAPVNWLELGPGKVLAGLVRRIDRRIRVISITNVASILRALD